MIISGIWAKKHIPDKLSSVYLICGREFLQQRSALKKIDELISINGFKQLNHFINNDTDAQIFLEQSCNQLDIFNSKIARKIFINMPFDKFLGINFAFHKVYPNEINILITSEELNKKTLSHEKIVAINNNGIIIKTEVLSKEIHRKWLNNRIQKLNLELPDALTETLLNKTYGNTKASLEYLQLISTSLKTNNSLNTLHISDLSHYTMDDLENCVKKGNDKGVYEIFNNLKQKNHNQSELFSIIYKIIRSKSLDSVVSNKTRFNFFKKLEFVDGEIKKNQNCYDLVLEILLFLTNASKYEILLTN
jgi:DNA polymerase III delta subunit